MFRRSDPGPDRLSFVFDGVPCSGRQGDMIAQALLGEQIHTFRLSAVSGQPRGPYCLMGACMECLVEVDGVENVQGCMTALRDGMVIRTQQRRRSIEDKAR